MEDVKKILVKLPKNNDDVIETFPFLYALSEEYPKATIHLLIGKGQHFAFSFLPFHVDLFELPENIKGIMQIHKFCVNCHDIFNIDLFFDLENTFDSALFGFNFRAKERIGYVKKWNKYLYTHQVLDGMNLPAEKKYLHLIERYLAKVVEPGKLAERVIEEPIEDNIIPLFKEALEPPKFIFLVLDNFDNVTDQIDMWKSFFDGFQGQHFIIWSNEDEDVLSDMFASIDLGHNFLYMHKGKKLNEFKYVLSEVDGVITNNVYMEGLLNFLQIESLSLLHTPKKTPSYLCFRQKPQRVIYTSPEQIDFIQENEGEEIVKLQNMSEVIDRIHHLFKL